MVTGHPGDEAEVLGEVAAHPLAEKFFPAIAVFRLRRVGIFLFKGRDVGARLLVGRVNAGGRGVEKAPHPRLARGHEQMRVDEHAEHAKGLVELNEPHAAHVGGQVVDLRRAFDGFFARFSFLEVELQVFDAVEPLIPFLEGFEVDRPQIRAALPKQVGDQVSPDKSTRAANDNFLALLHL